MGCIGVSLLNKIDVSCFLNVISFLNPKVHYLMQAKWTLTVQIWCAWLLPLVKCLNVIIYISIYLPWHSMDTIKRGANYSSQRMNSSTWRMTSDEYWVMLTSIIKVNDINCFVVNIKNKMKIFPNYHSHFWFILIVHFRIVSFIFRNEQKHWSTYIYSILFVWKLGNCWINALSMLYRLCRAFDSAISV